MDKIYYNQTLKTRAQELRRASTPQENRLWYDFLKNHPRQFRRQKQFARYIVDFYCSSAKLVIELDGHQHDEPDAILHDRARTAYLLSLGLHVIRFRNDEVDRHFRSVCDRINDAIEAYTK